MGSCNCNDYVFEESPNVQKQIDGYNCGVYLCYVIKQIVTCQPLSAFDVDAYRRTIEQMILNESDVSNICLFCDDDSEGLMWVECECCGRWVHAACTKIILTDGTSWENEKYECNLCKEF